jgi:hypothetical protein
MTTKIRNFIQLGNKIINVNMIKTITISSTQYNIHLISGSGGSNGFFLAGSGWIFNNNGNETITIFKETSPNEFQYLTDWIDKTVN